MEDISIQTYIIFTCISVTWPGPGSGQFCWSAPFNEVIQYFELVSCSNNEWIFHNYNLHFVWKISEIIFWIPLIKLQTSKKTCGFCWMFWLTDSPMRYLKNSNYSLSMPVPVPLNVPPLVLIISISRYHHLILHIISCATISTVPPSNKKKSYNETNFKKL